MDHDYIIEGVWQSVFFKEIKDNNISFVSDFLTMLDNKDLFDGYALRKKPLTPGKDGVTIAKDVRLFLIESIDRAVLHKQDKIFSLLLDAVVDNYKINEVFGIINSISVNGTKNNIDILSNNKKVMELGDDFWAQIMDKLIRIDSGELLEHIIKSDLLSDINSFVSADNTLLNIAIVYNRLNHIKLLLNNGADIYLKDNIDRNALDWVAESIPSVRKYVQNWDPIAYKQRVFEENFAKELPAFNAKKNGIKSCNIKRIKGVKI